MLARHDVDPRLGAHVKSIWTSNGLDADAGEHGAGATRPALLERTLPTGSVHFVFRLSGGSLRIVGADGRGLVDVGRDVVGGPRVGPYVRERSAEMVTVGVQLRAGAAMAVLGVPVNELAGRHVALDDVVGRGFDELRDRLLEATSPEARLACIEKALAARVARARAGSSLHPAIALAMRAFGRPELPAIGALAREAELSHRRFVTLFERAVGLAPSEYRRIVRLQRSLDAVAEGARPLAAVAAEHGFADQAHLTREVRALTGLTPSAYRAARPAQRNHVPLEGRGSDWFKTGAADAGRVPVNPGS